MNDTETVKHVVRRLLDQKYIEVRGTAYHFQTTPAVISALERARLNNTRVVLSYGDPDSGQDWNERFETVGRIGRSTGEIKLPLLVANTRSYGGGPIRDHCIVKIVTSKGKRVLYQHPTYHQEAE